jgi:hypothetical protein
MARRFFLSVFIVFKYCGLLISLMWFAGDSSLPSGAAFRSPVIPKEGSRGIFRKAGGQLGGFPHGGFG